MSLLSAITRLSSIAFMFGSSDVAPPSVASKSATTLAAKTPTAAYSTANFKSTGGLRHEPAVAHPSWGRRRYKSERDRLRRNSLPRHRSGEYSVVATRRERAKFSRNIRAGRSLHEHTGAPI